MRHSDGQRHWWSTTRQHPQCPTLRASWCTSQCYACAFNERRTCTYRWVRRLRQLGTQHLNLSMSASHQQRLTLLLCAWMSTSRLRLRGTLHLHLSLGSSRLRQLCTQHLHQWWITLRLQGTLHLQRSMSALRLRLQRTPCVPHQHMSLRTSLQLPQYLTLHLHLSVSTWRLPRNRSVEDLAGSGHRRTRPLAIVRILSRRCVQVCGSPETLSCKLGLR